MEHGKKGSQTAVNAAESACRSLFIECECHIKTIVFVTKNSNIQYCTLLQYVHCPHFTFKKDFANILDKRYVHDCHRRHILTNGGSLYNIRLHAWNATPFYSLWIRYLLYKEGTAHHFTFMFNQFSYCKDRLTYTQFDRKYVLRNFSSASLALQIILDLCIPEKEFAKTRSQISFI